jgi:uncharacterized protein
MIIRRILMFSAFVVALHAIELTAALAQTPPSNGEIAAYRGLHAAAQTGDTREVTRLVAAGADVNARDSRGRTPLHVATYAGRHEAMRALVGAGADPRAFESHRYDTVTIAAVRNDLETMKIALKLGGDPRAVTSPYHGTALIAAAHLGHVEIVRELIQAGAPLDHVNNLGWTALIEAVILGDGGPQHTATAKVLVDAGASRHIGDRGGASALEHARRLGYASMIKVLQ